MDALREAVDGTDWIDTHEHLLEPATRARGVGAHSLQPCLDFALLFVHYAADDLLAAGMPHAVLERFLSPELAPEAKWALLAPWWGHTRHTGYVRAVAETARVLYGAREWTADTCAQISAAVAGAGSNPGHYADVLRRSGVLSCQVNSLEVGLFCDSAQPEILLQDLSLLPLSTHLDIALLREKSGLPARDLAGWHEVIDWALAAYGPRAVAVKSQAAYARRLDYEDVPAETAAPLYARAARGESLEPAERKALEDHLMRYCLVKAGQHGLPVKLHCGYYAGTGGMPLHRVRDNAADLCPLLRDYPEVRFVLMHIGYPYQDEYIALAKHYPNAYIDLCWAWIINPAATARFVREYLLAAPSNKLLCFGGDYTTVENVAGHAAVARQGLVLALEGLVRDGWLGQPEAIELVPALMQGNARALFGLDEAGRLQQAVQASSPS